MEEREIQAPGQIENVNMNVNVIVNALVNAAAVAPAPQQQQQPNASPFDETVPVTESWSSTKVQSFKIVHDWVLDDFPLLDYSSTKYLDSAPFYSDQNEKYKFYLRLFPDGKSPEGKDFLSLYLFGQWPCSDDQIEVKFQFFVINPRGNKCLWSGNAFTYEKSIKANTLCGVEKFFSRTYLLNSKNGMLQNHKLKLRCKLLVWTKPDGKSGPKNSNISASNTSDVHSGQHFENLIHLLDNGKFSDITLLVGEKQFCAHKAILSARSSVFEAIFAQLPDLNEWVIEDVSAEVFAQLLRFVYSGTVLDKNELTVDLFTAANKYEIGSLINLCEASLLANLTVENVASTCLKADAEHATELKLHCVQYITENSTEVISTEGWKELAKKRPALVNEIYHDLAINVCNRNSRAEAKSDDMDIICIKDEPESEPVPSGTSSTN